MRRRALLVPVLVAAFIAGACGNPKGDPLDVSTLLREPTQTTIPFDDAVSAPIGQEPVEPAAPDGGGAVPSDATGTGSPRVRPGTTGGATGAGPASGATTVVPTQQAGAATAAIPMGRGVTATEIRIGFQVTINLQAGFAVVGAQGRPAEERPVRQAVIDYVNAHGGIAGRKLVPVWHEFDATQGTNESQGQAACSTFTEDNQVFAAVTSNVGGSDVLLACLAGRGVPVVELNLWPFDKPYFDRYAGLLYQPGRIRSDRAYPVLVDALADAGYFNEGHRLAILRFDEAVFTRMSNQYVKPRLAARKVNLVDEVTVSTPHGVAEFGGMSAQFNSAILRFRTAGVTHVMFIENAGIMPFFFLQQAESQAFRPRYALTSIDIPATVSGQSPAAQLNGAMGLGWTPPIDVYYPDHPGGNTAWQQCHNIMKNAGFDNFTRGIGFYYHNACDAIFFLKQALDRAPALTSTGLRLSVETLGTSYKTPYGLGPTKFGLGRTDGGSVAGVLVFNNSCACFRYGSRRIQVP